jgi:hypothetical protein
MYENYYVCQHLFPPALKTRRIGDGFHKAIYFLDFAIALQHKHIKCLAQVRDKILWV